jgi:uncharacterized membrane-anchored protein
MQSNHLPMLNARYWSALCLASIFGANMGDLCARNLGLGHVAGLPYLAIALALVMIVERFDRMQHQSYYWIAIIIVRTAATNFADFAAGDMKLPRLWVMAALLVLLVAAVWLSWKFIWQHRSVKSESVLRADLAYWTSMFIAGALGTVMGDFCSHNMHLGDAGAAILLSPVVAVLLGVGLAWAASLAAVLLGDGCCDPGCRDPGRRHAGRPKHARFADEHGRDRYRVHHPAPGLERNRKTGKGVRDLVQDRTPIRSAGGRWRAGQFRTERKYFPA